MTRLPTILFDLGAYDGDTIREAIRLHGEFDEIHAFEPLSRAFASLAVAFGNRSGAHLFQTAAGVTDGKANLFIGSNYGDIASSLFEGNRNCTPSDYETVSVTDFPAYFRRVTEGRDADITLKINIEGGEYAILRAMLADGSLPKVRRLHVDWHWSLIGMTETEHMALVGQLRAQGFPLAGNKLDEIHSCRHPGSWREKFRKSAAFHHRRLRAWVGRTFPGLKRLLRRTAGA